MKKLGYQMNFYARGLKTKNTYTVAALVPEILNPFFCRMGLLHRTRIV